MPPHTQHCPTHTQHCPINEQTGDGATCGRCWHYLPDGKTCPRHGDVGQYVALYSAGGGLTLENDMRRDRGVKPLGERPTSD